MKKTCIIKTHIINIKIHLFFNEGKHFKIITQHIMWWSFLRMDIFHFLE